jgi:hypothetical protein
VIKMAAAIKQAPMMTDIGTPMTPKYGWIGKGRKPEIGLLCSKGASATHAR